MKNDNNHQIRQARENTSHKVMPTDILVIPEVVKSNREKLTQQSRRRRRTNYVKKIMNDEFLFTV